MAELTLLDRQKLELLREVRSFIAQGHRHYICVAISMAANVRPAKYQQAADELRASVQQRLGHSGSLEGWLLRKDPTAYYGVPPKQRLIAARGARVRWLDSMIAQLEVPA